MTFQFEKATKKRAKARVAIIGPSGSGKTYTSLRMATAMGERIALIDTEHGSASLYADQFKFDVLDLDSFDPRVYIRAMRSAESAGYDVLIIDSLSHAWMGKDGALELVERSKGKYGGNKWSAWADVTPIHRDLIETILSVDLHLIATMRSKTEWVVQTNDKGRAEPRKVGLAPIQREGMEYEFSVVAMLDTDHNFVVDKTRCPALDGKIFSKPGEDVANILLGWLTDGSEPQPKPEPAQPTNGKPAPANNGRWAHDAKTVSAMFEQAAKKHPYQRGKTRKRFW